MHASGDDGPAVVNVRRPGAKPPESGKPHQVRVDAGDAEHAAVPKTLLRLPDLTIAVRSLQGMRVSYWEITQWVLIGLGALLALWLNFGGRRAGKPVEAAPAWTAPGDVDGGASPQWKAPAAEEAKAPAWDSGAPQYEPDPTPPEMPPEWAESAGNASTAVPEYVPAQAYTAQRPESSGGEAPRYENSSDPQPLGVTVPVQP